jgi:hypothetical protein
MKASTAALVPLCPLHPSFSLRHQPSYVDSGCFDQSLVPVRVVAGQVVQNVNVEDWYAGSNFCLTGYNLPEYRP